MNTIHFKFACLALALGACLLEPAWAASDPVAEPGCKRSARDELNLGYSLLHEQSKGLADLKWLVWLKKDTESFEQVVKPAIATYKDLAKKLEALPRNYPAVRIDLKAMPQFLGTARESMVDRRVEAMKPIFGDTGRSYEREVLLMLGFALDENRSLASAMATRETEANLARFLRESHEGLSEHLRKVNALLDRKYYTHAAPDKD